MEKTNQGIVYDDDYNIESATYGEFVIDKNSPFYKIETLINHIGCERIAQATWQKDISREEFYEANEEQLDGLSTEQIDKIYKEAMEIRSAQREESSNAESDLKFELRDEIKNFTSTRPEVMSTHLKSYLTARENYYGEKSLAELKDGWKLQSIESSCQKRASTDAKIYFDMAKSKTK